MPRSLRIRSIQQAEAEFLRAGRNEEIIEQATGAGSKNKPCAAMWDAVSLRHGVACSTFSEAFAACCGRGVRTWATFDLQTLRECLAGLDLPAWVYEQQAHAAEREWHRGVEALCGYADEAQRAWYEDWESVDEDDVVEEMGTMDWWVAAARSAASEPIDAGMFGIEIQPLPPQLPAWAWR